MRNEGPFLLEWVCWYRQIGFTDIVVVTNDCTDHSPDLLDALQSAGWVTHLRCDVPAGQRITPRKLKAAKLHPAVAGADWLLVCDVDEFLVIHSGEGRISDLLPTADPGFLAMAINWKVFGTGGRQNWAEGLVHRQFQRAGLLADPISRWVKVLHRQPGWFGALGEHGPKRLAPAKVGAPGCGMVNCDGVAVPDWPPAGTGYLRKLPRALASHTAAQMNHYMLRSEESFALKRGTLSPVSLSDRYNDSYYNSTNRNEQRDAAALRQAAVFDAVHAQAMALPGVALLHQHCCLDYLAQLCAKAGRPVADDPRHAYHLRAMLEGPAA
ncbi:conserved hypothetical protein [Rhodobacter ferrooxidans]|uniref:Glycosyl transferase family 2 n=2 Tax=Rhodobacter ferrooxidans TaxID=371731 RepID=C8RW91_9RHOB|nr:conserved hypothetical protein [Rhodobacter sp. SW2]